MSFSATLDTIQSFKKAKRDQKSQFPIITESFTFKPFKSQFFELPRSFDIREIDHKDPRLRKTNKHYFTVIILIFNSSNIFTNFTLLTRFRFRHLKNKMD